MIPPASQTQWNPINDAGIENPEAKNADADYRALLGKPLDLNSAKSAMGGIGEINPEDGKEIAKTALLEEKEESGNTDTEFNFEDAYDNTDQVGNTEIPKLKETTEGEQIETNNDNTNVDRELYNPETYSGQIRTRMAERFDIENGGNAELLEDQLSTIEGRTNNKKQIDTLFFGEGVLENSLGNLSKGEQKENLNWFQANTTEGGPLEASFERIKGNFILPLELQNKQLSEIHEKNPNNLKIVNDALADAILLEIASQTTHGKVNYSEIAVKALIHEIKDIKTPATEKIRKFGEIHSIVNTGVAKGTKQEKAYRERLLAGKTAEQENRAFYTAQAESVQKNKDQNTEISEELLAPEKDIKSGEVFTAGPLDAGPQGAEAGEETT